LEQRRTVLVVFDRNLRHVLRDDALAKRWSVDHCSSPFRDDADLLPCRADAGQCFSARKSHSATIWQLNKTLDKQSTTFEYVLRAPPESGLAREINSPLFAPCVLRPRNFALREFRMRTSRLYEKLKLSPLCTVQRHRHALFCDGQHSGSGRAARTAIRYG
jgi:hypothetical protein